MYLLLHVSVTNTHVHQIDFAYD